MGSVVADHVQRFGIAAGDENDIGVVFDGGGEVHRLAVQLHRQGSAGESGTNGGGHIRASDGGVEPAFGTVGQGDGWHGQAS